MKEPRPFELPVPEGCPLTGKQLWALAQVAQGRRAADIALERGRTESAIRGMLHHLYLRLGVTSSAGALGVFYRNGWDRPLELPGDDDIVMPRFAGTYLAAFDSYLASGADRDREAMSVALLGMCRDSGVKPVRRREVQDPLERLARLLTRL